MNEKKEYLNEENYEKGKKTLKRISLIILVIGLLIGGSLIVLGIIKSNDLKRQNEEAIEQVEQNNKARTAEEVQVDIDSLQDQIDSIETEITNLEREKTRIFQEDSGFSDRYYAKEDEIKLKQKDLNKLRTQLSDYEDELWKINSGYNDTRNAIEKGRNTISIAKYIPFYMFGSFIIIASCMIASVIYVFSKRREITAFTTQQVMPVAQEGIEKMAPTVGNAAKEVAKGIKEGLNEADVKKKD